MSTIRFSHRYPKMPEGVETKNVLTTLAQIFIADSKELSPAFVEYDTKYTSPKEFGIQYYPLPKGKVIVLILETSGTIWSTVRRWTPEKSKYYFGLVGKLVKIEVTEDVQN